jgi:phospholipid-translocating ATPase
MVIQLLKMTSLAVPSTQALHDDRALLELRGLVFADRPHKDIYEFVGNFRTFESGRDDRVDPLNVENTLWMNTVVAK